MPCDCVSLPGVFYRDDVENSHNQANDHKNCHSQAPKMNFSWQTQNRMSPVSWEFHWILIDPWENWLSHQFLCKSIQLFFFFLNTSKFKGRLPHFNRLSYIPLLCHHFKDILGWASWGSAPSKTSVKIDKWITWRWFDSSHIWHPWFCFTPITPCSPVFSGQHSDTSFVCLALHQQLGGELDFTHIITSNVFFLHRGILARRIQSLWMFSGLIPTLPNLYLASTVTLTLKLSPLNSK